MVWVMTKATCEILSSDQQIEHEGKVLVFWPLLEFRGDISESAKQQARALWGHYARLRNTDVSGKTRFTLKVIDDEIFSIELQFLHLLRYGHLKGRKHTTYKESVYKRNFRRCHWDDMQERTLAKHHIIWQDQGHFMHGKVGLLNSWKSHDKS